MRIEIAFATSTPAGKGYETAGLFVFATAEDTVQKLNEAGVELRKFIDELDGQNERLAELQLRHVRTALAALVGTLGDGLVHLGFAHDTRNWLQRILDEHPEHVLGTGIQLAIATLQLLLGG